MRKDALPWHSILIDVDEANAIIHGESAGEETKPLTLAAATQWLKTTHYVMQSIIDQDALKVTYGLNKSGAPCRPDRPFRTRKVQAPLHLGPRRAGSYWRP